MSGLTLDLAADAGWASTPSSAALGGSATLGWWHGRYDDAYAIGRFWGLGLRGQVHTVSGSTATSAALEFRRGMDLMIVKPWFSASLGAESLNGRLNPQLLVGGGAKLRLGRFLGPVVRLDGGPTLVGDQVAGRVTLAIGTDWSHPFRKPAQ